MPKTPAIPAVSILLTAILALILLHRPESVVGVSATPPMPENTTTTQLSEEHLWIEIPRKAHEPQLQIEIQPDKLILPEQDNQALSEQALDRQKKKLSYRFATRMELGKKASEIGSWNRRDGMATWRLLLGSPNATSLNLGLDQFHMPPGGKFVFSGNKGRDTYVFTSADNEDHGELWTPIVRGSTAKLEITLPEQLLPQIRFRIETVNHGFRDLIKVDENGVKIGGDTSGSCNVDVACSEGDLTFGDLIDFYRNQIGSVGAYTMGGTDTCSGALINNTSNDQRALFLTANHCGIDTGNAASMVVYWNFQNSTCRPPGSSSSGGVGNGDLTVFNTGSVFRAAYSTSDFCLVELDDPVNPATISDANATVLILNDDFIQPVVTGPNTDTGTQSTSYSAQITANHTPTSYSLSGAPAGMTVDSLSGEISWPSPVIGNYSITLRASNSAGTGNGTLNLTITPSDIVTAFEIPSNVSSAQSGSYNWAFQTSETIDGVDALVVSAMGGDSEAHLDLTINGPDQLLFFRKVSTEEDYDFFEVSLDGTMIESISGVDDWAPVSIDIPAGEHVVRISYTKDGDVDGNQDSVWIDQMTLASSSPPAFNIRNNIAVPSGVLVSLSPNPVFNITSVSPVLLPPGVQFTDDDHLLGTFTSQQTVTLRATNAFGSNTRQFTITPYTVDANVGNAVGASTLSFSPGNSNAWFTQTGTTRSGGSAIRSGVISDDQSSTLTTSVYGPGTLNFHWRCSTESDYDFGEVLLNGSIKESVSGEVTNWQPVTLNLEAGLNEIIWRYRKDDSESDGDDAVYVDDINLGGFAGWVASAGLSPYAAPPGSGTDGDENSALMEYAIGGSVTLAEALFQLTMNGDPGSVSISIPANDAATDISMKLQKSTNLQVGSWTDLTPRSTSPTLEAIDEQAHDRAFYRLHVEVP